MTTRTIVTSQPDVACQVCERRLLRGEQPDVFIAAGRRMLVCELCAPRAAHEGWLRESETQSVSLPPLRPRRGRSFLDRLRQVARPPFDGAPRELGADPAQPEYEFLQDSAEPAPATRRGRARAAAVAPEDAWSVDEDGAAAPPPQPLSYVEQALVVFNASEFPRRIAGVARSLGTPEVSARSAEHLDSVVRIVIAWELCWYRYEVDLSDGLSDVHVLSQGTELSELPREDRLANASAGAGGALSLAA